MCIRDSSYTIPTILAERLKIKNASVYVSADNMITISNWSGVDPETGYLYPLSKKVLFGVKVDF
jgi:hypothetical protein